MADVDVVVDKISQYKKYLDKYLAKNPDENKVMDAIEIILSVLYIICRCTLSRQLFAKVNNLLGPGQARPSPRARPSPGQGQARDWQS